MDAPACTPINHHSLLADGRTIALVDPQATIVWLCLPRIDSPALFASILGGPWRGEFSIRPVGAGGDAGAAARPTQAYVGDTFVLRTQWPGLAVVDYFDCSAGRAFQRAGRTDLVRVIEGRGEVEVVFAPRLEFGRRATRLRPRRGGIEIDDWIDPIVLYAPDLAWKIVEQGPHQSAVARLRVGDGAPERVVMELRYGSANLRPGVALEVDQRRLTERFWTGWTANLRVPPAPAPIQALVRRSALVLRALCQAPTGAIAAAGTTSLPAPLGGVRNWDYRYCWPRDACLAAAALVRLGNTGVALKLMDWLAGLLQAGETAQRLRPIYTVDGSNLPPESELADLEGYAGSRPVRLSNAAANQVQLDVYGPIVDLVAMLEQADAPLTPHIWRVVDGAMGAVMARWREPDHGIWEVRLARRHHIHSRVMCWQAAERACRVSEAHLGRVSPEWQQVRESIAQEVLARGCAAGGGVFTTAYDLPDLDAAALQVLLSGLLAPQDERARATVEAVARHLRAPGGVRRYLFDDGLPGHDGAFHLCTGWLCEALHLVGRHAEAQELLGELARAAGPTGLLAEQVDPPTGLAMGNFPQAYSHLALINAACRLWGDGAPA